MERMQKSIFWAILVTETSHLFCCVLPTVFSLVSFLASAGLVASMPTGLQVFHDMIHRWEIPLIIFSGFTIALGWAIDMMARRVDCHDTGCVHEPCGTRKNKAHKVLIIATALFCFNVIIYLVFHQGFGPVAAEMHHHH